jgi:flagellar protein FlgJ
MLTMPQTQPTGLQMPQQTLAQKLSSKPAKTLTPAQLAKINAAAKDFESVYAGEMLKPMFGTVKTDPMFGGGKGEETFKSLLLQEYGKKIANTGELGLAKYVKAEMIRMQETQR